MNARVLLRMAVSGLFAACVLAVHAQTAPAAPLSRLPEAHEYQKTLRAYMATLTEKDFEHGVTAKFFEPPSPEDQEFRYRAYGLTLMHQPLVGTKRGAPSINAPARLFTLQTLESSAEGVLMPPVFPEALMSAVQWDYAGNPYHNNRALKLRCFVTAAVMMMMTDDYTEHHPEVGLSGRAGYHLVYWGSPYPGFKDLLPPEVRQAYAAGLRRMAERMMQWGPRGHDAGQDVTNLVGLWYARQAVDDPAFKAAVDAYVGKLLGNPDFLHPAGYFVQEGGLDAGLAGMANYFAAWLALMTERTDAREAVERTYRLRAHLILPEPDGSATAPTHFQTSGGMPAQQDQWAFTGTRDYAAAMVTDEAAHLSPLPSPEVLAGAAGRRAYMFNEDIGENPRITEADGKLRHIRSDEIKSVPWLLQHVHQRADRIGLWRTHMTYNFPASVNPGYEFYPKGAYARRLKLQHDSSPMLKSPFERGETFVRQFAGVFVVANLPGFRAILHTGPVGLEREKGSVPAGFGGGQLSAFSTPKSGAVLMGRRSGRELDAPENWRLWPIHAVSGLTAGGKVFTSARIVKPEVATDLKANGGKVTVSGTIPDEQLGQGKALQGKIAYRRVFGLSPAGVRVETTVTGDGVDAISELYETLPVFLREGGKGDRGQPKSVTAAIEFQSAGTWVPATAELCRAVQAVRVTRFDGAVVIRFDTPQSVRLSPADWADSYLSHAACRNVLIDLLASGDKPAMVKGEKKIAYRIEPASK